MKFNVLILFLLIGIAGIAKDKLLITHGPFLQHLDEKGVTIVWTTNNNAVAWVELSVADSILHTPQQPIKYYSAEYGLKDVSNIHSIHLVNLRPGTAYRYKIYAQEVKGGKRKKVEMGKSAVVTFPESSTIQFSTADTSKEKKVSFLMVNDIHARTHLLEDLLVKGNYQSADFIFFNGDMVNNMQDEEQFFHAFMDTAIYMFAMQKPIYYARGNHETRGPYARAFPKYFKSPSGKLYYLLRLGPICFVVLDSGENLPDKDIFFTGMRAFDQYRDSQYDWLKEALKSKEYTEAPFKIAILHVPPFSGWHGANEIASKFVPLLNESNIDIMICGHLHRYVFRQPDNDINFPVLVNSNNTVLKAEADSIGLNISILNRNGEQVDLIHINK